jgi:glycosyltransferase involved in cell wall biosynthesis
LFYQRLQTFACRVSDLTVFQNHDDAHQFVAAGVVSQEKTLVILGSGVATDLYAPTQVSVSERDQLRGELGVTPSAIVVTMVGRVIRSKGVLEYMAAAQEVRARCPSVHFLLIGADDNESLDRLSSEELTQLRQALTWPGQRCDIPTVLALSNIFVFPSAYREGVPRVLLEAASMGLPIVTTDSPGCREVVENGVNGFLVPVRDPGALSRAIFRLVEMPELCRRFGRLSRQRAVERFDISVVAEQTRSLYRRLLARKEQSLDTES